MAVSNSDVTDVQRYYPQIYLACHRVRLMLSHLSREDRQRAIEGLGLLARAATALPKKKWRE